MGLIRKAAGTDTALIDIAQTELRQAGADATTTKMELGIPPRRRGAVREAKRAEKMHRRARLFAILILRISRQWWWMVDHFPIPSRPSTIKPQNSRATRRSATRSARRRRVRASPAPFPHA